MPERKRHVAISEEYLDGISGLTVRPGTEYDETLYVVDAALVEAHEDAWRQVGRAEEALREAMRSAPRRRNPKYRRDDVEEEVPHG